MSDFDGVLVLKRKRYKGRLYAFLAFSLVSLCLELMADFFSRNGALSSNNVRSSSMTELDDETSWEYVDPLFVVPQLLSQDISKYVTQQIVVNDTSDFDPLENCSVTSQVRIHQQNEMSWLLQSIDNDGNEKKVGGDEFYVQYSEYVDALPKSAYQGMKPHGSNVTAAAHVKDRKDGTYLLEFVTVPFLDVESPPFAGTNSSRRRGTLTIHFLYSCGIGSIPQPRKRFWHAGGNSNAAFQIHNVTRPPWRVFRPPQTDIDLSSYDWVISFGDSLMRHLVGGGDGKFRNNMVWKGNAYGELTNATIPSFLQKMDHWHGALLRDQNRSVALVVGSAMWDLLQPDNIQGADFSEHLNACREYVVQLRATYPHATVYWKLPSAAHRQLTNCHPKMQWCNERFKYFSMSRMTYLYEQQKRVMQEMHVPVLDFFQSSFLSPHFFLLNDGRHHEYKFDRAIMNWFLKY